MNQLWQFINHPFSQPGALALLTLFIDRIYNDPRDRREAEEIVTNISEPLSKATSIVIWLVVVYPLAITAIGWTASWAGLPVVTAMAGFAFAVAVMGVVLGAGDLFRHQVLLPLAALTDEGKRFYRGAALIGGAEFLWTAYLFFVPVGTNFSLMWGTSLVVLTMTLLGLSQSLGKLKKVGMSILSMLLIGATIVFFYGDSNVIKEAMANYRGQGVVRTVELPCDSRGSDDRGGEDETKSLFGKNASIDLPARSCWTVSVEVDYRTRVEAVGGPVRIQVRHRDGRWSSPEWISPTGGGEKLRDFNLVRFQNPGGEHENPVRAELVMRTGPILPTPAH